MNKLKKLATEPRIQREIQNKDNKEIAKFIVLGSLKVFEEEESFGPAADEIQRVRIALNKDEVGQALKIAGEIFQAKYPHSNGLTDLAEKIIGKEFALV